MSAGSGTVLDILSIIFCTLVYPRFPLYLLFTDLLSLYCIYT